MKRTLLSIMAVLLCFGLFFAGCTPAAGEGNTQSRFCRVLCVKDDGIILWVENIGRLYVKAKDIPSEIVPLHTVVVEFSESDLKPANGKFVDPFGKESTYSYILENPKSIRRTTEDEPTFG